MKIVSKILLALLVNISYGQVTFTSMPLDKQLVGRNISTNLGTINIEGQVSDLNVDYDTILVEVYRDNLLYNSVSQPLTYIGNTAPFNFNVSINAELVNYSLEIYGVRNTIPFLEKTVVDLVAGDAYIIQGQSNAEAESYSGSANGNQSNFIRVYANGTDNQADLLNNDAWYIGQGDGRSYTNGNTGQWGLKLARMLVDQLNIPIAIFNGAHPGRQISFFSPPPDYQTSLASNYGRLYYRLDKTGLKDHVRAALWSQGESDGDGLSMTTLTDYKNYFLSIYNTWLIDYPNIAKTYIFQTKNGCGSPLHQIKEAQRQLAFEDQNISIMSTATATHNSDICHFVYANGYELFGERIFRLVERDVYNVSTSDDIDAPMIQSANLINDTTLMVETDATSLSINTVAEDFLLENAGGATITNITTSSNNIVFTLSENPGSNATISYLAQSADPGNFITNQLGIEILCFDKYPIKIPGPLMITQYYESTGSNKWIEIKNISSGSIAAGTYSLAQYTDSNTLQGTINTTAPQQSVAIPLMGAGDVILFRNGSATLPSAGNLGPAVIQPTDNGVCSFDGNDVILISSSVGLNCYNDRIDIMGVVSPAAGSPPNWGVDKSFVKGSGNTLLPSTVFDENDFVELAINEVDGANNDTNVALGRQRTGSTTWNGSWTNGTSDRTRNATINNTYTAANGSLGALDLTVAGNLNFDSGTSNYVEVSRSLTVDPGGTFTIGDQESLYTVNASDPDDTVTISGVVTKSEKTTNLIESLDFTYWSSPVQSQDISTAFAASRLNRIFYWDQSLGDYGEWLLAVGSSSDPMTPGKGYISEGPTSGNYPLQQTVQFSGTPNNGTIRLLGSSNNDVVFRDDNDIDTDYNLIGNPYPSAIDANDFIDNAVNTSSIDGTLWFWTHLTQNSGGTGQYTTDDYATYNKAGGAQGEGSASGSAPPLNNIGSGQGFFVRAISAVEIIEFTDAMRLKDANTQFFRGSDTKNDFGDEEDRIWLNAESTTGGAFNQILIGFFDEATDGFDRGYDGLKFGANWIRFYSKINSNPRAYAIQGLGNLDVEKEVDLGFNTYISDAITYKISIAALEGQLEDYEIYLRDNELNITHDLKLSDYTFDVNGLGNFPDRFTLQFTNSVLGVDDLQLREDFVVVNEEHGLRLRSDTVIDNLKIYDIRGRLLIDKKPNDSEFIINTYNIRKGTILILKATFESGAQISKKTIKY